VELQDALLLMCVAYCLAANHAHAQQEHTPSHGDSPWFSDQESAIKVSRLHKCLQLDLSPAFNMTVSTCFDMALQFQLLASIACFMQLLSIFEFVSLCSLQALADSLTKIHLLMVSRRLL